MMLPTIISIMFEWLRPREDFDVVSGGMATMLLVVLAEKMLWETVKVLRS